MTNTATPIANALAIRSTEQTPDGDKWITVDCADYSALKALPAGIEYSGQTYAQTGWNSDRCLAYYATSSWAVNRLATAR